MDGQGVCRRSRLTAGYDGSVQSRFCVELSLLVLLLFLFENVVGVKSGKGARSDLEIHRLQFLHLKSWRAVR